MPTLTRLAAMILFGVLTYYVGMQYQLLYDNPPESVTGNLFLALVAAVVGWSFVGPRIDRSYFRAFTVVVQGYVATFLLALFLYGFYDVFTQGYAMRYKDLGDALNGVFGSAVAHLQRMRDQDFLILLLAFAAIITVVVTTVFRFAEARRLDT
jgi:hypothetical protein